MMSFSRIFWGDNLTVSGLGLQQVERVFSCGRVGRYIGSAVVVAAAGCTSNVRSDIAGKSSVEFGGSWAPSACQPRLGRGATSTTSKNPTLRHHLPHPCV
jgi:hypothetical protein